MGWIARPRRNSVRGTTPIPLRHADDEGLVGTKSANLCRLIRADFNVPDGLVLPFHFQRQCRSDPESAPERVREAVSAFVDPGHTYCVRSSTNLEDGHRFSFAGQFETYLDLDTVESVVDSVLKLFSATSGAKGTAYRGWGTEERGEVETAALVQEMIEARLAGVAFTRNPVTGMDEVVIETVPSSGVALMQQGLTPSRWVWKWGGWKLQGDAADESVVRAVVEGVRRIEKLARAPVDAEWVFDGERVHWLQYRGITALRNADVYSNRIAREQLPGLIKPLVWSINIPVVCGAWKRIFVQLLGRDASAIDTNRLARPFRYRAYYNMGVVGDVFELLGMPRESTELMLGIEVPGAEPPRMMPGPRSIRYVPRMAVFAVRMLSFGQSIRPFLHTQWKKYSSFPIEEVEHIGADELLRRIDLLMRVNTRGAYYVILSQLLMGIYNGLFKRALARRGIPHEESLFRSVSYLVRDIDPTYHLARIAAKHSENEMDDPAMRTWENESLADFTRRFGHLSDSGNDFSKPPWREEPETILRMLESPHRAVDSNPSPPLRFRNPGLRLLHSRAVTFRAHRERVNFCYTYGYGLFRPHFMRLGHLMVKEDWLDAAGDAFLLSYDEIRQAWLSGDGSGLRKMAEDRREEMRSCADIVLPEVIVGDEPPAAVPARNDGVLTGVAASAGIASGPARVVGGLAEADNVLPGDILVIPYSDVSWTPLFSRVGAIVSEAGGLLSHCSIVAREHGIPAVVSVEGAMRIPPGTHLLVDGYAGRVSLLPSDTVVSADGEN